MAELETNMLVFFKTRTVSWVTRTTVTINGTNSLLDVILN